MTDGLREGVGTGVSADVGAGGSAYALGDTPWQIADDLESISGLLWPSWFDPSLLVEAVDAGFAPDMDASGVAPLDSPNAFHYGLNGTHATPPETQDASNATRDGGVSP